MIDTGLKLTRKLKASCFQCIATVRMEGTRPDVEAILVLLQDYGTITPQIIIDHMLPNKPVAMAKNLIARYKDLGFLDEDGNPGIYAKYAFDGDILLPERGEFTICSTTDPIVLQGIVKIAYAQESRNRPTDSGRNGGRESGVKPVPAPQGITEAVDQKSTVWFEGIKKIVLESVDNKVVPAKAMMDLSLELSVDSSSIVAVLREPSEKDSITLSQIPSMAFEWVWEQILQALPLSRWKGGPLERGELRIAFDETTPQERDSFTRRIECPSLSLGDLGEFAVKPFNVAIAPQSKHDATRWAAYLMLSEMQDYLSDKEYLALSNSISEKVRQYVPSIPDRVKLMGSIDDYFGGSPDTAARKYWYLRAPLDLREVE